MSDFGLKLENHYAGLGEGFFIILAPSGRRQPDEKRKDEDMPISIFPIVVGAQLVVAVADRVPAFDIARSCKLDATATAGLSVDQSGKSCVNDEQKAKRQLASQWSKFPAPGRASCTSQESIGGTPSYVSLLTCLQMGQWSR